VGDKGLVLSRRCLAVPPLVAFPRPRHTHCCLGTGHWSPARGGEARERERGPQSVGSTKAWGKIWRHGEAVRVCGPWGWDMATPLLTLECLLQLLLSLTHTHDTYTHAIRLNPC
jgi:hypothetical protein